MPEDFARTLGFRRAPELPVANLVIGRKVEEAAQLLPRLFNLCRAAQAHCARLAFGLPDEDGIDGREKLRAEILRDHLLKFYATWPGFFGHAPTAFPEGWRSCAETLPYAIFGPAGAPPATAACVKVEQWDSSCSPSASEAARSRACAVLKRVSSVSSRPSLESPRSKTSRVRSRSCSRFPSSITRAKARPMSAERRVNTRSAMARMAGSSCET